MKWFRADEVFHPTFIQEHGEAVWKLRPQAIWNSLDLLREAWRKPITINSGGLRYCGVRPIDSDVGKAKKSRHKPIYDNVQAFDLHGRTHQETRELYEWILAEGWKIGNVERLERYSFTNGWVHAEISTNLPLRCVEFNP